MRITINFFTDSKRCSLYCNILMLILLVRHYFIQHNAQHNAHYQTYYPIPFQRAVHINQFRVMGKPHSQVEYALAQYLWVFNPFLLAHNTRVVLRYGP